MATRTISNAGGNWNSTATWVEAAVPTAADDVVATGTSGNLTVSASGAVCRSLNFTNYVGTFTHNTGNPMTIGDGTQGHVKFVAGMTVSANSGYTLVSTATGNQITSAGKALGNMTFNGAGGEWILQDNLSLTGSTDRVLTLTNGTLDLNGKNVTCGSFVLTSNSNTRVFKFANSTITLTLSSVGTPWTVGNATLTNYSQTSSGSTIIFSTTANNTFSGGGLTYGSFSCTSAMSLLNFYGADTWTGNVTINGPAAVTINANKTIQGLLTLGSTAMTFGSSVGGTQRTIALSTTGTLSLANVTFSDTAFSGTNAPASGTSLVDGGNNAGFLLWVSHRIVTTSSSDTRTYASGSFTPLVGDLVIVFVYASATNAAATLTDSAGDSYIPVAQSNIGGNRVSCFMGTQLVAAATSRTVTYDVGVGNTATGTAIAVATVAGMSRHAGTNAVRQQNTGTTGAGNTPSVTLAGAILTTNPVLGMVGGATNPTALTPPTGWTEKADTGYSGPSSGFEYASRNSGETLTTIPWTATFTGAHGEIVVELDITSATTAWTQDVDDTLTLSEALGKGATHPLADSLAFSEALIRNPGKIVAESVTFSEILVRKPGKVIADATTLSESLVKSVGHPLADVLTLSEALGKTAAHPLADTVTLSEALSKQPGPRVADAAATFTDALTRKTGKFITETLTFSDLLTTVGGFHLGIADSLTLSDTFAKAVAHPLADAIGFVDGLLTSVGVQRSITDSVTFSDALAKTVGKSLNDTITFAASVIAGAARLLGLSDTLTLTDALSKRPGPSPADALTLTDALTKAVSHALADTLTLSELLVAGIGRVFSLSDSLTLSDALSKRPGPRAADTIAFSEAITKRAVTKLLAETLTFVDLLTAPGIGRFLGIADSLTFSATFAKAVAHPLADTASFSDALARKVGKRATDTVIFSDALSTTGALVRAIADGVTFADALSKRPGLHPTDGVTFADALSKGLRKVVADTLSFGDVLTAGGSFSPPGHIPHIYRSLFFVRRAIRTHWPSPR